MFAARVARPLPAGGRKPALEPLDERIVPAAYTFPSSDTLFFQTSGRERGATIGDWYTTKTSASTDRVHRISIEITAAQLAASGGSVTVTVNDGESTDGPNANDESFNGGDPTRFQLLGTDGKTVIDSKIFAANSPDGQNYTFTAITKAGVYTLTSEDGAFPISGDATVGLNDDDNAFSVTVSNDGGGGERGLIGYTQATFQQTTQTTRSFNFFVGNATPGLFLRNFDLDNGVSRVFYTDPTGKEYAGTDSPDSKWNGGGDLNTGGDTITGPIAPGYWTVTFENYTAGNQSLFEANTTDGKRLTVFDTAILTGNVYIDANNDGVRQGTETGIGGATVVLTGADSAGKAVNVTTTTNPDGTYRFVGLAPSDATGYTVTETQPSGFLDGQDALGSRGGTLANDKLSGIVLAQGQAGDAYNFGELAPASLAGRVYFDRDASGTQTAGDVGISKAVVVLTSTDDLGNAVSRTATTAADGTYSFTGLRPSNVDSAGYTITETQPAQYLDGADNLGSLGGSAAVSDVFSGIAVTSGDAGTGYAFGELGPNVTGRVFIDNNRDGTLNGTDAGRKGVVVTLSDGTNTLTATTDASGNYTFSNVLPGTYTVTETVPTGFGTSTATSRPADATTGAASVPVTPFGLTVSTVSGTVYRDDNANNVFDPASDTKLSGVVVTLTDSAGNPVTDAFGNAVAAVTTGAAGTYSFSNLLSGSYRIVETQPAGLVTKTNTVGTFGGAPVGTVAGDTFTVPAPAGQDGVGYNFGEVPAPTATVSGFVYRDRNNNGLRAAAGEPGILGVVVVLSGTDDLGATVSRTATTDANGFYSFTGLRASSAAGYTLTETQPAGFFDGLDTKGNTAALAGSNATDAISGVTVATGGSATENDFGELEPSSIAGTVFRDDDNSGAQNGAEPGITGVVVSLSGTDDLGAAVSKTATTGAGGAYSFANLRPSGAGGYTLTETQPAAYGDGKDALGTLGGTLGNDVISGITVAANAAGTGYTFGELGTTLSGRVFVDLNRDGSANGADPGKQGVVVTLSDGTNTFTATTDSSGNYSFPNLPAGTYTLTETPPAGFGTSGGATTRTVTVPLGGSTGNNFGLTVSTLSGTVYRDDNASGTFNAGDAPLSGVVVTLFDSAGNAAVDAFGNAVAAITTGAAGTYSFANLLGGVTYRVVETQPAGLNSAANTVGNFGGAPVGSVTGDTFTVPAPTGADGTGYNFGEVLPGATVSGFVYSDLNNNGLRSAGLEDGIQGAVVVLSGLDDLGATVSRTATTDALGFYSFTGLRPSGTGGYTLTETQPLGFFDGLDTRGNTSPIAGSNTTDVIGGVTVSAGATASENDFGELAPGTLAGIVFFDKDNTGTNTAGDLPINGAKVVLSGTDDLGNAVNVTAFTTGGAYSFGNLRPGVYTLTETQPAGYLDGADTLGTSGGTPGNDIFTGVTLVPGATGSGYAFGELGPSITGTVFIDNNRDGTSNNGDPGKAGVVVNLLDGNGNTVATTTTGPGGTFTFGNQLPGTYTVSVVPTTGFGTSTPTTRAVDATGGVNPPAAAPVGLTLSTIAGRVYLDVNANGSFDSGTDSPIGGVQVRLFDAAGNPAVDGFGNAIASFSTGLDGTYSFSGVVGGSYQVVETQPANFGQGTNTVGTFGGAPVGTVSGDTFSVPVPNGRDGVGYNFGEVGGAVSGSVYRDANNNGVRDAGETGVQGVVLNLVNSAGTVVGTAHHRRRRQLQLPEPAPRHLHRGRADAAGRPPRRPRDARQRRPPARHRGHRHHPRHRRRGRRRLGGQQLRRTRPRLGGGLRVHRRQRQRNPGHRRGGRRRRGGQPEWHRRPRRGQPIDHHRRRRRVHLRQPPPRHLYPHVHRPERSALHLPDSRRRHREGLGRERRRRHDEFRPRGGPVGHDSGRGPVHPGEHRPTGVAEQ